MRIAICGTHKVGKTSLAEALAAVLPTHELIPEPYYALEEEGHEFGEMPSVDDFVLQLERSLTSIEYSAANAIFDRSPLDIVAYLQTHQDAIAVDLGDWQPRIEAAMRKLDLLIVVQIERPDRVDVPRDERRLREAVDERLCELIADDRYTENVDVLHVEGPLEARATQVLKHLG